MKPGIDAAAATPPAPLAGLLQAMATADGGPPPDAHVLLAAVAAVIDAPSAVLLRAGASPEAPARVIAEWPPRADRGAAPAWIASAVSVLSANPGRSIVIPIRAPGALYGQAASAHAAGATIPAASGEAWAIACHVNNPARAAAEACREKLDFCLPLVTWWLSLRDGSEERQRARLLSVALAVLSAVGAQPRFRSAAMALCNEVTTRWRGVRVSLGVRSGRFVKLQAMSRTEQLDRKTKIVQALECVMEECLDQDAEVLFPPAGDATYICREAKRLSVEFGRHHVLSLPMRAAPSENAPPRRGPARVEAVLTLEVEAPGLGGGGLGAEEPPAFTPEAIEALRLACNLVAPLLLKLYETDRWIGGKVAAAAQKAGAWAVGPTHTWAKLGAAAGTLALLFVTLYPAPHRVSAPFLVQAQDRQLVVAPYDGYMRAVSVEPGDEVIANDTVLAELETAELRLKLSEQRADREHYLKQADLARRDGKTAEMQVALAEAERVAADVALLEHQIALASLRSPMAGLVMEGDHRRKIGGAVSKGDVLFEVAPLDGLRAELRVPEDRVSRLSAGQRGELAAAALPGGYIPFTVEKIEPKAEVLDGQNVFRAWVALDSPGQQSDWLRPGMEGVAKVEVGTASYLWLWTHDAVDWVRMKLWL